MWVNFKFWDKVETLSFENSQKTEKIIKSLLVVLDNFVYCWLKRVFSIQEKNFF